MVNQHSFTAMNAMAPKMEGQTKHHVTAIIHRQVSMRIAFTILGQISQLSAQCFKMPFNACIGIGVGDGCEISGLCPTLVQPSWVPRVGSRWSVPASTSGERYDRGKCGNCEKAHMSIMSTSCKKAGAGMSAGH
jgi:hypothetical protein